MSRSTIVILAMFVGLLIAYLVMDQKTETSEIQALVVPGFLQGEISLQDIKVLNKDEESPYRSFEIQRGDEHFTLVMNPGQEDKKPSERTWVATRTKGDKTFTAAGESYRVKMINQVLARPFRSTYSFAAKPEELAEYGLDDATAVELTAVAPDRKIHLRIGALERGEGDEAGSTWVQDPGHKEVVYQVAGHDLRTEVAVGWKDIRERKILKVNVANVDAIELDNPRAPKGRGKVIMERPPLSVEQRKELADGKKWEEVRKSDVGWTIVEPKGMPAGDIGPWLESIERMTMTETYDLQDGKVPADAELESPERTVVIKLREGDTWTTIRYGGRAPKGDQQDTYVAVDGETIVYSVAGWSSDQIIKDVDGLRDVRLLGGAPVADVQQLEIRTGDATFTASRNGESWTSKDLEIDPTSISDWLRDLQSTRVEFRTGRDLKELGLVPPASTITLTSAKGKIVIEAGTRQGDKAYGRIDGGDPFELQSWSADRLVRTGRDFVDKHLIKFDKATISAITLHEGAASKRLVRVGDVWSVEGDTTVKIDQQAVNGFIESVASSSYHQEYDVDAASVGLTPPAWSATFTHPAGDWTLALSDTRRDNNPYATLGAAGGKAKIVTISAMMVDMFRKTFADVKAK